MRDLPTWSDLNKGVRKMTEVKELTGEKREKIKEWLKLFQKENDRSPTIEEVYDETTKTIVVEHFEAYGQCRDSRRITDLENKLANADYQLEGRDNEIRELKAQIEKMKCCGNCKNGELSAHEEPCPHCQRCFVSADVTDQENVSDKWELDV